MAVRFEVYRDGQKIDDFHPVDAIAIGPESVPLPGHVAFEDGILSVWRSDDAPLGLSLLWDAGEVGMFHLETTRLPHRSAPYLLNVELARFRLMKIIQKQEDWNLFEFPRAEALADKLKEASSLFAEALGEPDPGEASKLADRALNAAIDVSEQYALFHAELLINRRRASGQFVKHIFGCRVDPTLQNEKCKQTVIGQTDYAVVPMSWGQVQPQEGAFDTHWIDEWVDTLTRNRVPIIAGPLIRLSEEDVPDWSFVWNDDFEAMRDLAYEYTQKIVQRYRKVVSVWNVCAGLCANTLFPMTFEQIIELTRLLVSQVKNIMPSARTLITLTQSFGEYHARHASTVPPLLYAEMVAQSGISFEGFGLELELGVPRPGMFMRDLFQISCLLDRFSTLNKPLFVTALSIPGRSTADPASRYSAKHAPKDAGRWKRDWDGDTQAEFMEAVCRIALSKPYVESVAWGDLADMEPGLPAGGLLDDILQPKPVFTKLQELRELFHQWSGRR